MMFDPLTRDAVDVDFCLFEINSFRFPVYFAYEI